MKLISETTAELVISEELEDVLSHCEVACMADCCGLNAFRFSPLILAHYFMSQNFASQDIGAFPDECVQPVNADLAQLKKIVMQSKNSPEVIGFIKCLNQEFTKQSLEEFLTEIETNLMAAKRIAKLSEDIRYRKSI